MSKRAAELWASGLAFQERLREEAAALRHTDPKRAARIYRQADEAEAGYAAECRRMLVEDTERERAAQAAAAAAEARGELPPLGNGTTSFEKLARQWGITPH